MTIYIGDFTDMNTFSLSFFFFAEGYDINARPEYV